MQLSQGYVVKQSEDQEGNDWVLRTDLEEFALYCKGCLSAHFGKSGKAAVALFDQLIEDEGHTELISTRKQLV